jgi:hypothetical protein
MSDLSSRTCHIGPSVNSRTEKHGDEDVPACDIPIDGIMLDHDELEALVPGAHKAFFEKKRGSSFYDLTDFAKRLRPFKYVDKFEDSRALLVLGIDGKEIELDEEVKIAKIELDPQPGGLTALSIALQCTPDTEVMASIFAFMNQEIMAEVTFGKKAEPKKNKKQAELELDHHAGGNGDGENPDPDAENDTEAEAGEPTKVSKKKRAKKRRKVH